MSPVVRPPAAAIALIAIAGLLVACGSGGRKAATGGHTTAGEHAGGRGSPAGAATPMTRSQAIVFARAVNLTAADVPGFNAKAKHEHKSRTASEKSLERELQRCTGVGGELSAHSGLAEVSSKDFELEHNALQLSVSSEVSVARTAAIAAGELAAIRSGRVQRCLSHYLDLLLKYQLLKEQKSHALASSISVSVVGGTPPAPGATGSFGWQVSATIAAHGVKLPIYYVDILGFVYGSAEVTLTSSGALKPFPAAIQEHLYWLLLNRAKAELRRAPGKSHPGPRPPLRTSA
jgi:hypothetical protein